MPTVPYPGYSSILPCDPADCCQCLKLSRFIQIMLSPGIQIFYFTLHTWYRYLHNTPYLSRELIIIWKFLFPIGLDKRTYRPERIQQLENNEDPTFRANLLGTVTMKRGGWWLGIEFLSCLEPRRSVEYCPEPHRAKTRPSSVAARGWWTGWTHHTAPSK